MKLVYNKFTGSFEVAATSNGFKFFPEYWNLD